jgi:hypothetical protein
MNRLSNGILRIPTEDDFYCPDEWENLDEIADIETEIEMLELEMYRFQNLKRGTEYETANDTDRIDSD